MKKLLALTLVLALVLSFAACNNDTVSSTESAESEVEPVTVELTKDALKDKILGAWFGQMFGVAWGASQEFWYCGKTMPDTSVPALTTFSANDAFTQDDLYVEITYVEQMAKYGYDCSLKMLANAFRDSKYGLDHANKQGRENLRNGIDAPGSGSYLYNFHCDDIDWQINSDFVGQIYPGNPKAAAERSFEIGHITNYGDGVYGGVFVSAMNSAAYTAKTVDEVIQAGLDAIPDGTKFKDVMDDVVDCYDSGKTWLECWQVIEDKWNNTDRCLWCSSTVSNIDAKLNSAYILIGLLYGEGVFEDSVRISMQCGQDSDCNPSSVGGILGTFYGYKALDNSYKTNLDLTVTKFLTTNLTLSSTVNVMTKLAEDSLEAYSTYDETTATYTITAAALTPVEYEQWPDMPTAQLTLAVDDATVTIGASYHDLSGIKSIETDLGDGFKTTLPVASYSYAKAGTYTITLTVTSNNDQSVSVTSEVTTTVDAADVDIGEVGTVRNIAAAGLPICNDTAPLGSGNKSLNVIRDGYVPAVGAWEPTAQYDTFIYNVPEHEDYIGYAFGSDFSVSSVVFVEGMNFDNGGWFANGTIRIEAYIDAGDGTRRWQTVTSVVSPDYPNSNTQSGFGTHFEAYTFTFDAVTCTGIRVIGTAGGSAGFIGVAELEVVGVEA